MISSQTGRCKLESADRDGNTLLHHCCMVSHIENSASLAGEMIEAVFKSPKSKALDVSHQNKEGKTALHLAGARGMDLKVPPVQTFYPIGLVSSKQKKFK